MAFIIGAILGVLLFFFGLGESVVVGGKPSDAQMVKLVGFFVGGGGLFMWLCTAFIIVEQKSVAIIEVLGKFFGVRYAGLRIKPVWPLGNVAARVSLKINQIQETVSCKSKDDAILDVPVSVQLRVTETNPERSYYELDNPAEQIKSLVLNSVRSKAAEMTMGEIFSSRDLFQQHVMETLREKFGNYGYQIEAVLVDNPQPSDKVADALNDVLSSEQRKKAATNDAEADRIKVIAKANAEAESLKLKGEAFAAFRKKIAEGNSEAMQVFLKDVEGLNARDVLDFFTDINRQDAIREAATHGNVIILGATSANTGNLAEIMAAVKAAK